jgi:hypothetical protein
MQDRVSDQGSDQASDQASDQVSDRTSGPVAGVPAGFTRREVGKLGLGLAAAVGGLALGGRTARADDTKLVTEIPENAAIVSGIQYVNESPNPDKLCSGCVLYTPGENDRGKCTMFPNGVVKAGGYCISWAAKPA